MKEEEQDHTSEVREDTHARSTPRNNITTQRRTTQYASAWRLTNSCSLVEYITLSKNSGRYFGLNSLIRPCEFGLIYVLNSTPHEAE